MKQNPIKTIGKVPIIIMAGSVFQMVFTTISYVAMGKKVCPEREALHCYVDAATL